MKIANTSRPTILFLILFCTCTGLVAGHMLSRQSLATEIDSAVEACTAEVADGCPLLYQYVSELERENSRLNLALTLMAGGYDSPEGETGVEGSER